MPITILETSRNSLALREDVVRAKEFCDKIGNSVRDMLGVPDANDKESRVLRGDLGEDTLRIAFTVGPNEYPGFEKSSFYPEEEQIESAGQSVLNSAKESGFNVSRVLIEKWENTTFVPKKGEISEPASPISEKELKEIGSHLKEPKMKLFLSHKKQEGGPSSKEGDLSSENEKYKEVALKLSKRMTEMLGREDVVKTEIEFVDAADTDFSVEFDCETQPNKLIPQEARQCMAESALYILDQDKPTKEGSGEVWIRQGQPKTYTFT
jgi:hypothetical protein